MKPKLRNHLAIVARQRNGGPMKHRNTPRGGARNAQADLLDEDGESTVKGVLSTDLKTLKYLGCEYHVRYAFEDADRGTVLVLSTDCLMGKYGDEFPLSMVKGKFTVKPAP